jgi:hypothetical protein
LSLLLSPNLLDRPLVHVSEVAPEGCVEQRDGNEHDDENGADRKGQRIDGVVVLQVHEKQHHEAGFHRRNGNRHGNVERAKGHVRRGYGKGR